MLRSKPTELTYMLVCTIAFRRDLEAPSGGKDDREMPWSFQFPSQVIPVKG